MALGEPLTHAVKRVDSIVTRHLSLITCHCERGPAMTDNPRLRQLLDELHESHATPEEVCRSCPELLLEVRARWRAVCRVRAELDALFPAPTVRGVGAPALLRASASLPQVPSYNVEAVLGHGGMGVVYQAWHLRLHRRVALKMLLAGAHAQPD